MKNMMLFLMALLMSSHMMAQQTIVTGVITDANDGSPLIGANGQRCRNRFYCQCGR